MKPVLVQVVGRQKEDKRKSGRSDDRKDILQ
jgi:hypothetical protein